jgi:hypothetical protein
MPLYPIKFYWLISENCLGLKLLWLLNFDSRDVFLPPRLPVFFLWEMVAELLSEFPLDPPVPLRLLLFQMFPLSFDDCLLVGLKFSLFCRLEFARFSA